MVGTADYRSSVTNVNPVNFTLRPPRVLSCCFSCGGGLPDTLFCVCLGTFLGLIGIWFYAYPTLPCKIYFVWGTIKLVKVDPSPSMRNRLRQCFAPVFRSSVAFFEYMVLNILNSIYCLITHYLSVAIATDSLS